MATQQTELKTNANIIEKWNNGYKLEIDITAESNLKDWQLDFNLPFNIAEAYGVDLIDKGNGNYSINGQDDQNNLQQGQSIKTTFVIENNGNEPSLPEFNFNQTETVSTPETTGKDSDFAIKEQGITNSNPGSGQFSYGEALQKSFLFYEANRSGPLPDDNRLEWRSDSAVQDGSDVGLDLTGGYYDAGDTIKFGFPMAASMTMLSWGVEEYQNAYARSGQLDEALEAIKWGTDFFLKAHVTEGGKTKAFYGQVGNKTLEKEIGYWGSPEEMSMERPSYKIDVNNPGSDLAGETAAALASASIIFRSSDAAYADKLLNNAKQLYEFAETYQGKYSDSITDAQSFYESSGYTDELAWGATWLYKATGDSSYLDKAKNYHNTYLGDFTHDWDNKTYGTAVLLAQEFDDPKYRNSVETWLDGWINGTDRVQYTSAGLAWSHPWGPLRYTSNTAFLAGVYSDTVSDQNNRYFNFANSQMDYILGDNPSNFSYVVGFGDNSPQRAHHMASHDGDWGNFRSSDPNQHILYGALVGGPSAADDFSYNDVRYDYMMNEVATDYNAALSGSLARMYDIYGGDPLSESELDQLIGVDANGVSF